MKLQLRSPVLLDFEDTRPAPHFASQTLVPRRSGPPRATARPPVPQDTWLRELPPVDASSPALAWSERRAPHWLRVAGLAAAALLALFALGLAASLLDAQRGGSGADREHLAAKV